jgi:subtilisin family serine protease
MTDVGNPLFTPTSNLPSVSAIPGLAELWGQTQGDPRISIAVLDGPVDQSHPCFDGARLQTLPTFVANVVGVGRMCAHATHIASTIFGQTGCMVRGIAPRCSGLIVPIFSDETRGPASQLELARAIIQAVEAGADVINISGGELSNSGSADSNLASAVRFCNDQGVLIVAAAGNDACRCLHVPAALPSVLAVGAMDAAGLPLELSNWGDAYQTQGILAPGQNILGAVPGGGIALKTGTSFATPIVTGIIALLLSFQLARGDVPDPDLVRQAILASAIQCDNKHFFDCQRFLAGQLNLPGAYTLILNQRRIAMSVETPVQERFQANDADRRAVDSANSFTVHEASSATQGTALEPSTADKNGSQIVPATAETKQLPGTTPAMLERVATIGSGAIRLGSGIARSDTTSPMKASGVVPSCACHGNGSKNFVFAIGSLGYDFGTEARRDGFRSAMPNYYSAAEAGDLIPYVPYHGGPPPEKTFPPNPYDARQLVKYLGGYPPPTPPFPTEGGFPRLNGSPAFPEVPEPPKAYPKFQAHLSDAADLIWVLNIELTPIYAIRPVGTFSTEVYQRLVEFLAGQVRNPDDPEYVSRVSIPGVLTDETVQLFSGQAVRVVIPNLRGMYAWNENALISSVLDKIRAKPKPEHDPSQEKTPEAVKKGKSEKAMAETIDNAANSLRNFLDRMYYDLRNLGQTSPERAMNFTATNAFQAAIAFSDAAAAGMQLDTIMTERSPFCRKDSDCWDVKLRFFDPDDVLRARLVSRFTIDVSDTLPVLVGPVRTWSEPG